MYPFNPIKIEHDPRMMNLILKSDDFKQDYKLLKEAIHSLGTAIPPLVNAYMNTSPELKFFGTAINDDFGDVEETGILVGFDEMYHEKRARHVESYIKQKIAQIRARFPSLSEKNLEKVTSRWESKRKRAQEKVKEKINRK